MSDQPPKKRRVQNVRKSKNFSLRGRGRGRGRERGKGAKRIFDTDKLNQHLKTKKRHKPNPPEEAAIPAIMNNLETTKSKQPEVQKPTKKKRIIEAGDLGVPPSATIKPKNPFTKDPSQELAAMRKKLLLSMKKKDTGVKKAEAEPALKVPKPARPIPQPSSLSAWTTVKKAASSSTKMKSPGKKFKLLSHKKQRMVSMDGFSPDAAAVKGDVPQKPEAAPPTPTLTAKPPAKPEVAEPTVADPKPPPPQPKEIPTVCLDLEDLQGVEGISDAFLDNIEEVLKKAFVDDATNSSSASGSVEFNGVSIAALAKVKMDLFALDVQFAKQKLDVLKRSTFDT